MSKFLSKFRMIVLLVLAFALVFSLTACNEEDDKDDKSKTGSVKSAVNSYYKVALGMAGVSQLKDMAPDEVWECYLDEYDITMEDVEDYYEDEWCDEMAESLEEEVGKNAKFTLNITGQESLPDEDLERIKEALDKQFGIKAKTVKKVRMVTADVTLKGADDEQERGISVMMIQIGDNWYAAYYYDIDEDEVEVTFPAAYQMARGAYYD